MLLFIGISFTTIYDNHRFCCFKVWRYQLKVPSYVCKKQIKVSRQHSQILLIEIVWYNVWFYLHQWMSILNASMLRNVYIFFSWSQCNLLTWAPSELDSEHVLINKRLVVKSNRIFIWQTITYKFAIHGANYIASLLWQKIIRSTPSSHVPFQILRLINLSYFSL